MLHRWFPASWDVSMRPPRHEQIVGVVWRLWAANSPGPPTMIVPWRTGSNTWETIVVLWGWVAVHSLECHVFVAPRYTALVSGRRTPEPLSSRMLVASNQVGAAQPQPWRDLLARVLWRDVPTLRASLRPAQVGELLPAGLLWVRELSNTPPSCPRNCVMPWDGCIRRGVRTMGRAMHSSWQLTTTASCAGRLWRWYRM